jgi:uncharacterized protein YjbI with pentapeptide repeats
MSLFHLDALSKIDLTVIDAIFGEQEHSLLALAIAGGVNPATFYEARDFRGLSLDGIDVRGVSLRGANLIGVNLRKSIIDATTCIEDVKLDEEDKAWIADNFPSEKSP